MSKLNEIQQKLSVPKNQFNKFGGYNYRSCEDIVEAVKPLLGDAILTVSDELVHFLSNDNKQVVELIDSKGKKYTQIIGGDRFYIKATAILKHNEDEWATNGWAREAENKKGMDDSQITGTASSYARKYALNGLFAIDDTRDADTQKPTDQIQTKSAPEKKKPDNNNLHHWQKVIGLALMAINDNDQTRAGNMLVELTKSDDGKYKGFNSVKSLKSEKQAKFIFDNKIKEKYSTVYDIDSLIKEYEVVIIDDGLPFDDEPMPESARA